VGWILMRPGGRSIGTNTRTEVSLRPGPAQTLHGPGSRRTPGGRPAPRAHAPSLANASANHYRSPAPAGMGFVCRRPGSTSRHRSR